MLPSRFRLQLALVLLALVCLFQAEAAAQSFQIEPSQIEAAVAPGFNHADLRVPITGTAVGFDYTVLAASSDAVWVTPSIDAQTHDVLLVFNTANLVNSSNTATVTVTGGGTTDFFSVKATVASLNITKLVDDPIRSRVYGIHEAGLNTGAVIVIDPITNAKIASITAGKKPTDLAVSADGSELLVINAVDKSISAIDLATLRVTETILLPTYFNWDVDDTTADVAYGRGNTIYYTDGSAGPVLYVFNRATGQVVQQITESVSGSAYGIGDFALSPDGSMLYGWIQWGWGAGWAGSYLISYAVAADGKLSFLQRTNTTYPTGIQRDPLDTPVFVDAATEHVFVKQLAVNPAAISETKRTFPGPVYSISPGGEVAATASAIYQVSTNSSVYTLPVTTSVQTITSDYARLVYFNKTSRTIGTIDLIAALGPQVLNRNLSPADGAITLAPEKLEWTPLPGVDTYRIYFGTSESTVQSAGTADAAYLGETNVPTMALTASLTPGTKYFWRIDAVTTAGVTKGDVYDFTVSLIGADRSRINEATVQGHAAYDVNVQLTSPVANLAWQASADKPWVGFVANAGTAPGTLTVRLNALELASGVHTATVTVTLSGSGQTAFTLPVTLEVDPLALKVMESDRTSSMVYALSEQTGSPGVAQRAYLLELDSAARVIKRVVRVGTSATDLCVHNADGRIYVTNWLPGLLLAIDKTSFQLVRSYAFNPFGDVGYSEGDVYRVAAGTQGRVMVEAEDQWIDISIFDTATGTKLKDQFEREGGGEYSPSGRYYYHGDNNSSGAEIHKYDLTGDVFAETAHTRVDSVSYYGSRTVVVSEDGERVFWNGAVFNKDLVVEWLVDDEIFSASADGRLAFSADTIYDVNLRRAVLAMPANGKVSAYNSTSGRLVIQVGSQVKFFNVGGLSPLPAPVLSLQGVTLHTVQLGWTDESLESGFTLQRRATGETQWQDVSSTIAANATSYTVTGLVAGQEYEFRIKADSSIYTSAWSNIVSATTIATMLPAASTLIASNVVSSGATLNGSANPNGHSATAYFEYGLTTSYGSITTPQNIGQGTTNVPVSYTISQLAPVSGYHFRLVAVTADGTARGLDQSFTTLASKPLISMVGIGNGLTSSSVTLQGAVYPNGSATTAHFEYGTTLSLGQSTSSLQVLLSNGSLFAPVEQLLTGLLPNTTYYYRLVATNAGGTTTSAILSFKTLAGGGDPDGSLLALDDLAFTAKSQPRVIEVLANDVGASLHLVAVARPSAGTAVPNPNGTITYVPGKAFMGFDLFTYVVGDALGRRATATVVINDTFLSSAGTYHALVGASDSAYERAGEITITISSGGALTGKLVCAGASYPLKGVLRYDGVASLSINKGTMKLFSVGLQIDPASHQISGGVSGPAGTTLFSAFRASYNELNPAPHAGRYTVLLAPDETGAASQGYGYATMRVNAEGFVQMTGRTGSGAPFSHAALIGGDERFPFYVAVNRPRQTSHQGWVEFRYVTGTSDCDGTIGWSRASAGGSGERALIGSRYIAPGPGELMLPFARTFGNAMFEFGRDNAGLTHAPVPVTLTATRLVPQTRKISELTLDHQTGFFSGSLSLQGEAVPFYGVVFQRQAIGAGVVKTNGARGWVLLSPSPAFSTTNTTSSWFGGTISLSSGSLELASPAGGSP